MEPEQKTALSFVSVWIRDRLDVHDSVSASFVPPECARDLFQDARRQHGVVRTKVSARVTHGVPHQGNKKHQSDAELRETRVLIDSQR